MNIIITGASRGIGFETAKTFAANGNHNIFAIARNKERLKELKEVCYGINNQSNIIPIAYDLTTNESFENSLLPIVKQHVNSVDILVNNAGLLFNKPLGFLTDSEIDSIVNVNLTAPIKLIKTILPLMKTGSHVVNVSSMGGFQGSQKFPGLSVYSASKAGIASLTECLAEEYKDSGIKFNCLALGAANTEMLREAFPGYIAPFTANDIAEFIVDFALTKHKFFNGKIIPVSISTP